MRLRKQGIRIVSFKLVVAASPLFRKGIPRIVISSVAEKSFLQTVKRRLLENLKAMHRVIVSIEAYKSRFHSAMEIPRLRSG